jgi:tetratricopeptide (TPR) repeat protein
VPHADFARGVDPDDGLVLTLQARIQAGRGDRDAAERLARRGIESIEQTDQLTWQGDAWWDLGEVLLRGGGSNGAVAALEEALRRYERKKNLAMAAQLRLRLDAVR